LSSSIPRLWPSSLVRLAKSPCLLLMTAQMCGSWVHDIRSSASVRHRVRRFQGSALTSFIIQECKEILPEFFPRPAPPLWDPPSFLNPMPCEIRVKRGLPAFFSFRKPGGAAPFGLGPSLVIFPHPRTLHHRGVDRDFLHRSCS